MANVRYEWLNTSPNKGSLSSVVKTDVLIGGKEGKPTIVPIVEPPTRVDMARLCSRAISRVVLSNGFQNNGWLALIIFVSTCEPGLEVQDKAQFDAMPT